MHADVVDGPSIHGDRSDAFRRKRDALSNAGLNAFPDFLDVPVKTGRGRERAVRKAMYDIDGRLVVPKAQQRDAATLRAQIYGDQRLSLFYRFHRALEIFRA